MDIASYKDFPPVGLDIAELQARIAADAGEVIWRQDLAELGNRIFDLDIYKHGPAADVDGQGVALRQLHLIDSPAGHGHLSQPDANHYQVTPDGLRLRLRPEDTDRKAYSTSEWAAGPCRHLDQQALVRGMLEGDPRVVVPGRSITWRIRLSPGYARGTARGTFGVIAQDFRGHEDPGKRFYDYTVMSIVYIGPDGGLFGRLLWGGSKPRLAIVAADYSLGVMWFKPLPDIDVTAWHEYTIAPELTKVSFLVDGKEAGRFEQGQRAFNLMLMQGKPGWIFRRGFLLPGPCQPDAWVDNNTASGPRVSGYCKFEAEQWAEIAWVEVQRLPVRTWCVDGSGSWPYYTPPGRSTGK
jgi:hypothetical protein